MRTFFNNLSWILFAVFAIPTILVLGSWNSLPGEPIYGIKLGMEQALLVLVSPSLQAKGDLSIKYTERRFSENKRLLSDKGSVEGLAYLDKQVVATKDVIVQGNDVKEQAQLAQKYIDTLNDVSQQLAAQQQVIASAPPPTIPVSQPQQTYYPPAQITAAPTPIAYASPTQTPAPKQTQLQPSVQKAPPSQTSQPAVQQPAAPPPQQKPQAQAPAGASVAQAVAVQQIKQSQETIKETIKELEKVTKKAEKEEKQQEKQQEQQPSDKGNKGGGKD